MRIIQRWPKAVMDKMTRYLFPSPKFKLLTNNRWLLTQQFAEKIDLFYLFHMYWQLLCKQHIIRQSLSGLCLIIVLKSLLPLFKNIYSFISLTFIAIRSLFIINQFGSSKYDPYIRTMSIL